MLRFWCRKIQIQNIDKCDILNFSISWTSGNYRAGTKPKLSSDLLSVYNLLRLLHEEYNQVFSEYGVRPFVLINFVLTVLSIYGTFRLYNSMNVIIYLFLPCFTLIAYIHFFVFTDITEKPYEYSKRLRKNLRAGLTIQEIREKVMSRQILACKPLSVPVGGIYAVKRSGKIIELGLIINACAYLLLSL